MESTRLLCPWGFYRQKYWSGLPFPPPGDLFHPGIEPASLALRQILYHLSNQGSPKLSPNVSGASGKVHTVVPSDTYLVVDHMAHSYSQPHPHTLNVKEVQVVQNGPHEHAGAQSCHVAIGFMQSGRTSKMVVFNITNNLPQTYGLNYSGAFLKEKKLN